MKPAPILFALPELRRQLMANLGWQKIVFIMSVAALIVLVKTNFLSQELAQQATEGASNSQSRFFSSLAWVHAFGFLVLGSAYAVPKRMAEDIGNGTWPLQFLTRQTQQAWGLPVILGKTIGASAFIWFVSFAILAVGHLTGTPEPPMGMSSGWASLFWLILAGLGVQCLALTLILGEVDIIERGRRRTSNMFIFGLSLLAAGYISTVLIPALLKHSEPVAFGLLVIGALTALATACRRLALLAGAQENPLYWWGLVISVPVLIRLATIASGQPADELSFVCNTLLVGLFYLALDNQPVKSQWIGAPPRHPTLLRAARLPNWVVPLLVLFGHMAFGAIEQGVTFRHNLAAYSPYLLLVPLFGLRDAGIASLIELAYEWRPRRMIWISLMGISHYVLVFTVFQMVLMYSTDLTEPLLNGTFVGSIAVIYAVQTIPVWAIIILRKKWRAKLSPS